MTGSTLGQREPEHAADEVAHAAVLAQLGGGAGSRVGSARPRTAASRRRAAIASKTWMQKLRNGFACRVLWSWGVEVGQERSARAGARRSSRRRPRRPRAPAASSAEPLQHLARRLLHRRDEDTPTPARGSPAARPRRRSRSRSRATVVNVLERPESDQTVAAACRAPWDGRASSQWISCVWITNPTTAPTKPRAMHDEESLAQLVEMLDERRLFAVVQATRKP